MHNNSSIDDRLASLSFLKAVHLSLRSLFGSEVVMNTAQAYMDVMEQAFTEVGLVLGNRAETVKVQSGAPRLLFIDALVQVGVWAGARDKLEPDFNLEIGVTSVIRLSDMSLKQGAPVSVTTSLSGSMKAAATKDLPSSYYLMMFKHEQPVKDIVLNEAVDLTAAITQDVMQLASKPETQLEDYKLRARELIEEMAP